MLFVVVESFRQALMDSDEQMTRLQVDNGTLQSRLADAIREAQMKEEARIALERRLNDLERKAAELRGTASRVETDRVELRRVLDDKDSRLRGALDDAKRYCRERDALKKQLDSALRQVETLTSFYLFLPTLSRILT